MKQETVSVVETLPVSRQTEPERTGISRRGKVVIALLFALSAIGFTDKAIAGYVAVSIMGEFHLSSTQWGIVSGSFFWLFSLSSLLVGAWSDRVGTRWVLSLVAVVWTIVQVATVFVTSFPLLLLSPLLDIGGPFRGLL